MLYDPKWDKRLMPEPESMPAFIAWLETKDPDEGYHYMRPRVCACGQYAEHIGVGAANWMASNKEFWAMANILAMGELPPLGPLHAPELWTFRKLLERCRAYVEA